jgi:MFS transporter, DHA3 family, macrolide efflux protein
MMLKETISRGQRTFLTIAIGQIVSLLGSSLTNFALALWVLQNTGSVTQFGVLLLFISLPGFFLSPFAGAWVDRYDRRKVLILSDAGSALSTIVIAVGFLLGYQSLWLVAIALAFSSICGTFRLPAYLASITLLVPKDYLPRANGIVQIGEGLGKLLSPLLAGALLGSIGVQGILLIDFVTFLFAVAALMVVHIPNPTGESAEKTEKEPVWKAAAAGWYFIRERPGMLGLLSFFTFLSFIMSMAEVTAPPLLLASASPAGVGAMVSIFGSGLLVGSVVLSSWRGPKIRIYGVYLFALVHALALAIAGANPHPIVITAGLFLWTFSLPLVNGYMRAIYQVKTPADMQGRVFATASTVVQGIAPLALIITGPLADRVFEPLLSQQGALANTVGQVIGAGKGRGIGLMMILMGATVALGAVVGFLYPRLRHIEKELPDAIKEVEADSAESRTALQRKDEKAAGAIERPSEAF